MIKWFAICGVLGGLWFWADLKLKVRSGASSEGENGVEGKSFPNGLDLRQINLIDGSPLIHDYGRADSSMEEDLDLLIFVLQDCQLLIKNFDELFLPDNAAIVNFLRGSNRDKLAWIPSDHPFVNDDGCLLDRWGNPLFFHRESGFRFSLRSAGPDGKMWSKDDIVR